MVEAATLYAFVLRWATAEVTRSSPWAAPMSTRQLGRARRRRAQVVPQRMVLLAVPRKALPLLSSILATPERSGHALPASLGTPGLSLRLPVGPRPAAFGWPLCTVLRPSHVIVQEPTTPFWTARGRHLHAYIDNLIISIALLGLMLGKLLVVQVASAMLQQVRMGKEINTHPLEPFVVC